MAKLVILVVITVVIAEITKITAEIITGNDGGDLIDMAAMISVSLLGAYYGLV